MNKKFFLLLILICNFLIQTKAFSAQLTQDELVEKMLKNKELAQPEIHSDYNYQDTTVVPVRLHLIADIESEQDVWEGQTVYFQVVQNVYHNHKKLLEKGEIIPAKIETIITSGMNGIPASIIIGDFQIKTIKKGQLTDTIEKHGQDRSLWVYPLKWALTILPPTGSLTNFIKGGHAKLKSDEVVEIYFHPEWI